MLSSEYSFDEASRNADHDANSEHCHRADAEHPILLPLDTVDPLVNLPEVLTVSLLVALHPVMQTGRALVNPN